jgi:hypothetical protein
MLYLVNPQGRATFRNIWITEKFGVVSHLARMPMDVEAI